MIKHVVPHTKPIDGRWARLGRQPFPPAYPFSIQVLPADFDPEIWSRVKNVRDGGVRERSEIALALFGIGVSASN